MIDYRRKTVIKGQQELRCGYTTGTCAAAAAKAAAVTLLSGEICRDVSLQLPGGEHICVVGTARPEQRNPIYLTHELIVLILVVERETGVIVGCDINMVCSLTREFIKSVFEGKNLIRDIEEIRESIQENYFGASAKTVVMAARSARMKLLDCLENRKNEHQ